MGRSLLRLARQDWYIAERQRRDAVVPLYQEVARADAAVFAHLQGRIVAQQVVRHLAVVPDHGLLANPLKTRHSDEAYVSMFSNAAGSKKFCPHFIHYDEPGNPNARITGTVRHVLFDITSTTAIGAM